MAKSNPADDTEDEWEETLLMLQLPSKISNMNSKNSPDTYCQILGISSDQPLMKIKNQVFTGQVTDTVGSHMFLEMEGKPGTPQAAKNHIKNVTVSDKTMVMSPVFLKPKESKPEESEKT